MKTWDVIGASCLLITVAVLVVGRCLKWAAPKQSHGADEKEAGDRIAKIGPGPNDWLCLPSCFTNILGTGQVGSSKTTGFLAHIALGLLMHPARLSFLVLCWKSDEASRWLKYAAQANRLGDVIHMKVGGEHKLDLMDAELSSKGGSVETARVILEAIMENGNRNRQRNSSDSYWPESSGRKMGCGMTLSRMAGDKGSLTQVFEFCQSLPTSPKDLSDPQFVAKSYACQCLLAAKQKHMHSRAFQMAANFVCDEWPNLSDKTRSVIQSVTLNTLDKFLSGPFADLISSGRSTFLPGPAIEAGKIVLWGLPGSDWGAPAQWSAIGAKLLFHNAVMRRDLSSDCRPLVIFADEAAQFCVPHEDAMFLSQSRQFKTICVSAIQNFPLLYTALGGTETARHQAQAWISNHATLLAAANSDTETNTFYQNLIGERKEILYGGSSGTNHDYSPLDDWMGRPQGRAQGSWSEQYRPVIPASFFTSLRRGGKEEDFWMEALVFQSGRRFSNGKTWIKSTFRQIL